MKKILLIKCSVNNNTPRGSVTGCALEYFKNEYIKQNPNDEIIEKDLNKIDFLKTSMDDNNASAWFDQNSKDLINELKSVDRLIIATSMMNFNYPSILKNYIDKICLAGETFKYKYDNGNSGSEGLVKNLKVSFILSSGSPKSWYLFSNLSENLKGLFEFLGCSVVESILIDGTKIPENFNKTKEEIVEPYKNDLINLVSNIK